MKILESVLLMLVLFSACSTKHNTIGINEIFVNGGNATIGNDVDCSAYQSNVPDLFVSTYEITWDTMVKLINIAISKKYVKIENDKVIPLIGFFPQFNNVILEIDKNNDFLLVNQSNQLECIPSSLNKPASNISWYGMALLCNVLSETNKYKPCYDLQSWDIIAKTNGYRMPTFEEWEFFARGGNKSKLYKYSGSNNPQDVGWFAINSNNEIHSVGLLQENELGLYDMSGNVNEYCTETYKPIITSSRTVKSALKTSNRIWRGGSFASDTFDTYYYRQNINNPEYYFPFKDVGLRIVRQK